MPSKEVLSAAAHRYQARHDDRLTGPPPAVDLEAVVERKNEHTSDFAAHRRAAVHGLAERENVAFHHANGRLVDDRTVRVEGRELEADYLVVATGSVPNVPELPGLGDVEYMTSADVLDATTLPESGVVMGFGYVGIEMAPYLAEAGVDLTVIEHDERPLEEAPPAFGDELVELYRREFGIDVLTETRERRVEPTGEGVRLHVERDGTEEAIEAEALFLFTGRRPNLDGLELENTALEPGPGWVEPTMQARDDERTFVVGDANGLEPILHVAKEQGFRAAENVLRHRDGREVLPYENVTHRVMFAGLGVYPFARVGHTADSAREAGYDPIEVGRRASDDGVFKTKAVPEGLARLVVDRDGTVLGYQGLHYHADAMAKTMQLLVERGTDVREVPDRAYHPTTPEILDGLFRAASRELSG
jgi:dihydrolipoamide dehydrogenase